MLKVNEKLPCAQLRLCVPSSKKQSGKQNSRSAFTISIDPYYILLIHLRKVIKFGISSRVSKHFLNRCVTKCFTLVTKVAHKLIVNVQCLIRS